MLMLQRGSGVALLLLAMTACASRGIEVREYVITPMPSDSLPDVGSRPAGASELGLAIGVGPVELPAYLRRRQIVTRQAGSQLVSSEANSWGEDLESSVARVLAENLSALLPSNRVVTLPWQSAGDLDYLVAVQIQRFERDAENVVHLDARWSLTRAKGRKVVAAQISAIRQTDVVEGYPATVDGMSRAVEQLSREITQAIQARSR